MEYNSQIASFSEMTSVISLKAIDLNFDIILDDIVDLQSYCDALIQKVFELPYTDYPDFISYQTNLVKNPIFWLNHFEELISNNEDLFTGKRSLCRYNKLFNLIESKRKELQSSSVKESKLNTPKRLINADTEDRYFSFHETKLQIEKLECFNEKIIFLTEEIFDYEEADIISKNGNLGEFNLQCEKLKVRLQTTRKLLLDIEKEKQETILKGNSEIKPTFKIRINGPINILTDVYKQMMYSSKSSGKSYINHSIKDITKFICDNHLDEQGNELSQHTIRTYLSPTRCDKDPNNDNKIRL
ncbi:hypothetical protein [Flavobacterium sp.]|uniref:hypothetical protein n=1 Tax=Flavobacterium sp. TaxID=239 RepID=UPI00374C89D0